MSNFIKKIQLPAQLENIPLILSNIRTFLKKKCIEDEQINKIELSLEEILVNIVNYSYPNKIGDMEVTYSYNASGDLTVKIIDMGIPFNPLSKDEAEVTSSLEERKVGGLGIHFVKKIVNDIEYRHYKEKNILTLVFDNLTSK
jgi:anti-sigma regulatory factor (Ser/Thr protein kinase)